MYFVTWTWENEVKMFVIRNDLNLDDVRRTARCVCGPAGTIEIKPIVFGVFMHDQVANYVREMEDVAIVWDSER